MATDSITIGLADAAHHLRIPYQDAHRLVLTGQLRAEKRKGRWLVEYDDVEQLMKEREGDSQERDQ
jgi:predicted site-specific integrase-resolvase